MMTELRPGRSSALSKEFKHENFRRKAWLYLLPYNNFRCRINAQNCTAIVCSAVYAAGFAIGILAVGLISRFFFSLPEADGMSPIMGGSVCSNLSATLLFSRITGEEDTLSNVAFSIYLICIVAISLLFFIVSMKAMLLLFAVVSFVINGVHNLPGV